MSPKTNRVKCDHGDFTVEYETKTVIDGVVVNENKKCPYCELEDEMIRLGNEMYDMLRKEERKWGL